MIFDLQFTKAAQARQYTSPCSLTHGGRMRGADTLLANLTVHEMLLYTAEMRNKVSLPADAKRERVEAVLSALGLKPCRDVLIGDPLHRGISGVPSVSLSAG